MKFSLSNGTAIKLLFISSFLVFLLSISYAQEYQHTLLKPYGFDMLAKKSEMLNFLSEFEIEPRIHYDPEIYLTTIEPSNQIVHEQLNLDYAVVFFRERIMAIGFYNKDHSYRDFLIKEYGPGDTIQRDGSESEFKWEIDGYIVRLIIMNDSDFIYRIRSIDVYNQYDSFLEERAKIDPYF